MTTRGRSEASRNSLVEATSRLLRERGVQGLRVRDVAAYAGMSPGAVLYHFENTDELLLAVHQRAVTDYVETRTSAVRDGPSDPRTRLLRCFRSGVPIFAEATTIELLYEVHSLARRSHRHAQLLTELWAVELALYVEIIEAGLATEHFTTHDPATAAQSLLALEDGLVLHLTSRNEGFDSVRAIDTFQLAAAEILHCPSLATMSRSERR